MSNLTNIYQVTGKTATVNGNSGALPMGGVNQIEIDVNVSAMSGGSIVFVWNRIDAFGNVFPVWTSSPLSAPGTLIADIGNGLSIAACPGTTGQLSWTVSGGSPNATFSAFVEGR